MGGTTAQWVGASLNRNASSDMYLVYGWRVVGMWLVYGWRVVYSHAAAALLTRVGKDECKQQIAYECNDQTNQCVEKPGVPGMSKPECEGFCDKGKLYTCEQNQCKASTDGKGVRYLANHICVMESLMCKMCVICGRIFVYAGTVRCFALELYGCSRPCTNEWCVRVLATANRTHANRKQTDVSEITNCVAWVGVHQRWTKQSVKPCVELGHRRHPHHLS